MCFEQPKVFVTFDHKLLALETRASIKPSLWNFQNHCEVTTNVAHGNLSHNSHGMTQFCAHAPHRDLRGHYTCWRLYTQDTFLTLCVLETVLR